MTTASTIGRWRRVAGVVQAALALGLPFVRVGGESALRLDIPAGRLHAFGASFAVEEGFVVLAGTLVATFALLLGTLVLGRAWCGWSCPQTVLSDLTSWVVREERACPRRWRRPLGFAAAAAVSVLFSAAVLWYFVPPLEFLARLRAGQLGPVLAVSWAVLSGILFADLGFLRQVFCATACPYARLQGVLLDRLEPDRRLRPEARRRLHRLRGVRPCLPDRHRHPRRSADGMHRLRRLHRRLPARHAEAAARARPGGLLLRRRRGPRRARGGHAPPAPASPRRARAGGRDRPVGRAPRHGGRGPAGAGAGGARGERVRAPSRTTMVPS